MTEGFYKERGTWVLSRAGRKHGARRRGERLMAKARKGERDVVGAGEMGVAETVTPNLWVRATHKEGATTWTVLWVGFQFAVVFLLVGPALLLAKLLYGIRYVLVNYLGPMRPWSWLVASGVALAFSIGAWFWWPPVSYEVRLYLCAQVVLALLRVSYLVYANGWMGVQRSKAVKATAVEVDLPPAVGDLPLEDREVEATEDKHLIDVDLSEGFDDMLDVAEGDEELLPVGQSYGKDEGIESE